MCSLEKRGNLFILTLKGYNMEHRLNPTLLNSINSALLQAKAESCPGSALVTISHGKFFSNGMDLDWVKAAGSTQGAHDRLFEALHCLKQLVITLLSLPMPTVAAVTGHAVAAGFAFVLSHDYIVMRRDKGVLYMSEMDMGLKAPEPWMALFRAKLGSGSTQRDVLLRGMKIKGDQGLKMGIVESVHEGEEEVRDAAMRLAQGLGKRKWDGKVYAETRKGLYPELCGMLGIASEAAILPKL
ncbi:Crotonase superfamily [Corchorus capsularis]|uniref:Delta(3)-Delta(2)-enoyl-CoA isomerase n=1 Tax=Corchorus capsularis TaxID=210143 RepID=A0A1R3G9P4_COCAP|nr:Crotonase superfamily [Corchorus capsularis]